VRDDNYEPNRVLGMPRPGPYDRQGEEQQRVAGIPVDWIGPVDPRLKALAHPVQAFRRWRHRQAGDAPDDSDS
jgi:hypothetical protein